MRRRTQKDEATPKRRGGGRAAKAKGTRAEVEFANIATTEGVPTMRVVMSGALKGAEGDLKIGVELLEDGSFPAADEGVALMRGEVKNRLSNREEPYVSLKSGDIALIVQGGREAPELPWNDLNQNAITKAVIWKRAKTPVGALKEGRWDDAYLVFMGAKSWLTLIKELISLRKEVRELRATIRVLKNSG